MTTDYMVFQSSEEGWREIGWTTAESATSAVRSAASEGGSYVAIPKRSFKPVLVEVETQPRVKIVEGDGS